eukprot:2807947-Pleurochrysis_carterae.AAC.3
MHTTSRGRESDCADGYASSEYPDAPVLCVQIYDEVFNSDTRNMPFARQLLTTWEVESEEKSEGLLYCNIMCSSSTFTFVFLIRLPRTVFSVTSVHALLYASEQCDCTKMKTALGARR